MVRLGLGRGLGGAFRGRHRNVPAMCSTYDFRVVRERDESTRSMKLPLDLYGTHEQAGLGTWVLQEPVIVPPQDAPIADLTPRATSRSERLLSPKC